MSRTTSGALNQIVEARALTSADNLVANVSNWRGNLSSCMGGIMAFGPISAAAWVAGDPLRVVLDESADWRDRLCWVRGRLNTSGGDIRPGTETSTLVLNQRQANGPVVQIVLDTDFYTANGHDGLEATARGGANLYNYTEFLTVSTDTILTTVRIYADKDTGKLMLYSKSTNAIFGSIMIFATEQTGKISSVP